MSIFVLSRKWNMLSMLRIALARKYCYLDNPTFLLVLLGSGDFAVRWVRWPWLVTALQGLLKWVQIGENVKEIIIASRCPECGAMVDHRRSAPPKRRVAHQSQHPPISSSLLGDVKPFFPSITHVPVFSAKWEMRGGITVELFWDVVLTLKSVCLTFKSGATWWVTSQRT